MPSLSSAVSNPLFSPVPTLPAGPSFRDLPTRLANRVPDGTTPTTGQATEPDAAATRKEWRILWIDDDVQPDAPFLRLLAMQSFRSDAARSGAEGLAMARASAYKAIVVDLHLPDMFGLTVLQRLRANGVAAPVLVVTGHYLEPEIETDATRAGAAAFRYKPFFDAEEIAAVLRSIIAEAAPSAVTGSSVLPSSAGWPFGIVAVSPAMQRTVEWINRVASAKASALLTGETGTGKELVARALHQASPRCLERFVPLNCAAIPESLVEAELFGHRKGAFTGALSDREKVSSKRLIVARCFSTRLESCRYPCKDDCSGASRVERCVGWATPGRGAPMFESLRPRTAPCVRRSARASFGRTCITVWQSCNTTSHPCASGWKTSTSLSHSGSERLTTRRTAVSAGLRQAR